MDLEERWPCLYEEEAGLKLLSGNHHFAAHVQKTVLMGMTAIGRVSESVQIGIDECFAVPKALNIVWSDAKDVVIRKLDAD